MIQQTRICVYVATYISLGLILTQSRNGDQLQEYGQGLQHRVGFETWLREIPLRALPTIDLDGRRYDSLDNWLKGGASIENLETVLLAAWKQEVDAEMKVDIVIALRFLGGVRSIDVLSEALDKGSWEEKYHSAVGLGRIGGKKALNVLCLAAANSQDGNLRVAICVALANIGGLESLACIKSALTHQDPFVRDRARSLLEKVPRK